VKECVACAEEIKDKANLCRFCGTEQPRPLDVNELSRSWLGILPKDLRKAFPSSLATTLSEYDKFGTSSSDFSSVDLDWLFFGGMWHQHTLFGGTYAAIDLQNDQTENFDGGEVFWPPHQTLTVTQNQSLLGLFHKYSKAPRLWEMSLLFEDPSFTLEIDSRLQLPPLQFPHVTESVIRQIDTQFHGQANFLADQTRRMFAEQDLFVL
jgi:hypothetical protein